jgi:hypothetical protein
MLFVGREFSVFGGRSPAALRRARNSNMRTLIARRPVAAAIIKSKRGRCTGSICRRV